MDKKYSEGIKDVMTALSEFGGKSFDSPDNLLKHLRILKWVLIIGFSAIIFELLIKKYL